MSVQYNLSKNLTIKDLKNKSYNVEKINKEMFYPFLVNDDIAISKVSDDSDNDDDLIIEEFDGKCSQGGLNTIIQICKDFNCLFITDEDIDDLFCTSKDNNNNDPNIIKLEVTKDTFINRAKKAGLENIDLDNAFNIDMPITIRVIKGLFD